MWHFPQILSIKRLIQSTADLLNLRAYAVEWVLVTVGGHFLLFLRSRSHSESTLTF